ncbi:low-density lipoprotein receptor class A domain-containing protein 2 precursor, partial [Daubentonia madagascariensis]
DLVALCGQTWQGDGLLLRSHSASRRFYFVAPDTDCGLWVQAAAPGDRIRFQFRFFLVYSLTPASSAPPVPSASSPAPAHPCSRGSFLQFYEGPPGAPRALGAPVCGLTIPAPVASSGPFLGLRLVTRGRQPRVDFVGEVTSFRLVPSLVPSQTGGTDVGTSKPSTLFPPLGSADPLWIAAERSPPAGRDPAQQNATSEGSTES